MAKKLHTDGSALQHDHPYQTNAHTHRDSSVSSGNSLPHGDRTHSDGAQFNPDSVDYIPPELSIDDHQDSDVRSFIP